MGSEGRSAEKTIIILAFFRPQASSMVAEEPPASAEAGAAEIAAVEVAVGVIVAASAVAAPVLAVESEGV